MLTSCLFSQSQESGINDILFIHFYFKKTSLPLPVQRCDLAYNFSGLLIWVQYEKSICEKKIVFAPKFLVYRGEMTVGKPSGELFRKIDSPRKQYTNFTKVTLKCCCFTRSTKFPPLVQTLSFALRQNSGMLITFLSSEGEGVAVMEARDNCMGTSSFTPCLCPVLSRGRLKMTNQG